MKYCLIITTMLMLASCNGGEEKEGVNTDLINNTASAGKKSNSKLPEMTFTSAEHDFGRITQGERVRHEFEFENTGSSNLLITDARGSCGCTVPEWPKQPLKPGEKGVIKVEFNSEGKAGYQEKTITVATNCEPATRVLRIKADIVVPETAK